MIRAAFFAALAAALLLLQCAAPASALGDGATSCDATACNAANNWFKLPRSSVDHPANTGTCTPCADSDTAKCSPANAGETTAGTCQECCYPRKCINMDGLGTSFCPHGYESDSTATVPPPPAGAAAIFDACCQKTIDNSFPAAKDTFPGGIQAIVQADVNWAFQSDTNLAPTASSNGPMTGMCFTITSTQDCDGTDQPECCKPNTKPAFLQFKLPVSAAMTTQGTDPRFNALSKLQRCRLSYARTTTKSVRRLTWKFTNQNGNTITAGAEAQDARYATVPLNFGTAREVTMCLYTADTATDMDCSWENICGIKDGPNSINGASDAMSTLPARGCEIRLIGHSRSRVGPTLTSKCVANTYTVYDYSSVSDFSPASIGGSASGAKSAKAFALVSFANTTAALKALKA